MLYRRRRQAIARTILNLEIGDCCQSIVPPINDLIHPPNCYRFVINKAEINLHLVETNLYANLYWNNGVSLLNMPLEYAVQLSVNIKVGLRKIKLLKSLLLKPHYVTIHVINVSLRLQNYQFQIQHVSGSRMPADFLSRAVTTKDEKAADLEDDSALVFTLYSLDNQDRPFQPTEHISTTTRPIFTKCFLHVTYGLWLAAWRSG